MTIVANDVDEGENARVTYILYGSPTDDSNSKCFTIIAECNDV